MNLEIAFITAPRHPAFIHKTLASLIQADERIGEFLPVYLFADTDEVHYLQRYESIAKLFPLTPDEMNVRRQFTDVRHGVLYNHWRSVHAFRGSSRHLLVCEDDISFAPDWLKKLEPILEQIHNDVGEMFVLTLYSFYDWPQVLGADFQKPYVAMEKIGFYGSQAVLFSPPARAIVEDYLWHEGVEKLSVPSDLRIRDCCIECNIPLLSLVYSLVQHEGYITSGGTGQAGTRGIPHRSPTFLK